MNVEQMRAFTLECKATNVVDRYVKMCRQQAEKGFDFHFENTLEPNMQALHKMVELGYKVCIPTPLFDSVGYPKWLIYWGTDKEIPFYLKERFTYDQIQNELKWLENVKTKIA